MKMKNWILAFCATTLFFSCEDKSVFKMEGEIPDKYAEYNIIIANETEGRSEILQVLNGKFHWEIAADTTTFYSLYAEKKESATSGANDMSVYIVSVIPEGGKINIDLSKHENSKLTPLNEEFRKYLQERSSATNANSVNLSYFLKNKNNAVGKLVLYFWQRQISPEQIKSLLEQLDDNNINRPLLEEWLELALLPEKTKEGMMFTDFTIENGNFDGSAASLSDYVGNGKYVLVDFWASWCGPCIREVPVIAEVYKKYKGDKFEVLGIAVNDKREKTLEAIKTHGITWPQIIDAGDIPLHLYAIHGIPHIILFAPDGTILARGLRGEALKTKVAEVMK